ncbi:glycerol-3-phosphate responsive antiterminator [Gracilibacillus alcaliphilus]|uniref:glycerol-3-phosphate responsive antiterminator n=1 Tax=Gracilibacillus alcaliphilus TaxID=1401441 RepID=UPI001959FEFC|nr:glycerol-3-phosphate responsive antiterminator [Gracilibacillus alcaliphilus]MBM7676398.1 glycerol uptake operon antiterminator [Gracilibacillus alcaliphilus]
MKLQGVLPAVRKMKDFEKVLQSDHSLVILLETRIAQLPKLVQYAKQHQKKVFVHGDLINGLKLDRYGLEFLVHHIKIDGIISTRANVIALAKQHTIYAIQRLFAIDSSAVEKNIDLINKTKPDYVEVLPGIIPSVIKEIIQSTNTPVIAGGLIKTREEVEMVLTHGAVAVTTSEASLWQR